MTFIQRDNSIQRLTQASFTFTERKYNQRAIPKAARQTFLDMGQTA
jgi:hypothetical protein